MCYISAVTLVMVAYQITETSALIGLRPARKTPAKVVTHKPIVAVSPSPTQLHSPYSNPATIYNTTVDEPMPGTSYSDSHQSCHHEPLLRCSFWLLQETLKNETSVCSRIQDFSTCLIQSLRTDGRRDFAVGMIMLHDLQTRVYDMYTCPDNGTHLSGHTRHQRAKRHGSACCTDGIINCTIQTFFKMAASNPEQRCPLVDYYDTCLSDTTRACHSILTSYPVFISQLKRVCRTDRNRRRRSLEQLMHAF